MRGDGTDAHIRCHILRLMVGLEALRTTSLTLLTKVPLPEVWAKRLGRSRLIETRGEGVGTIIRATEAFAGRAPVWKMVKGDGGPALRLTIPPAPRR